MPFVPDPAGLPKIVQRPARGRTGSQFVVTFRTCLPFPFSLPALEWCSHQSACFQRREAHNTKEGCAGIWDQVQDESWTTHRPRAFVPHVSIFGKTYGKLGLIECVTGPSEGGPRYLPLRRHSGPHKQVTGEGPKGHIHKLDHNPSGRAQTLGPRRH